MIVLLTVVHQSEYLHVVDNFPDPLYMLGVLIQILFDLYQVRLKTFGGIQYYFGNRDICDFHYFYFCLVVWSPYDILQPASTYPTFRSSCVNSHVDGFWPCELVISEFAQTDATPTVLDARPGQSWVKDITSVQKDCSSLHLVLESVEVIQ